MPYVEWKNMGFSKGTSHYMKQNAMSDKPFTLNAHVMERFEKVLMNNTIISTSV